jgi:hypothetical protein
MMDETLTFDDLDDGDESLVGVRAVPGGVGLALSKKSDGDLEVVMPLAIAERVASALRDAAGKPSLGVYSRALAQARSLALQEMVSGLSDVSFHDAEVLALWLNRAGPTLEIDVAVVFPERRTLRVRFDHVTDVELDGFNEQNVLFDLKVVASDDGLLDVEFQSSYGVGGSLRCASIAAIPA